MAPTQTPDAATELPTKCGCGGDIAPGIGCATYYASKDFDLDSDAEHFRRVGGLGFGNFDTSDQSIMSTHLQQHGLTPDQAKAILFADHSVPLERTIVIPEEQREYQAPQPGPSPYQHD